MITVDEGDLLFSEDERNPDECPDKYKEELALDCLGVILEFVRSYEIFKSVILVSKGVRHYIESTNPYCCRNITFRILSPSPPKVKLFVHRMIIDSTSSDDIGNEHVKYFPNVTKLDLIKTNHIDWNIFKHTPNLLDLSIENCEKLVGIPDFGSITKIRSLKIDFSHLGFGWSDRDISTKNFPILDCLEKLDLCCVTSRKHDESHFRKAKNLKILKLKNVPDISDKIFQYTPNLEILELSECNAMKGKGFKNLSKLVDLRIFNCIALWRRKVLRDNIGIPRIFEISHFEFVPPRMRMGEKPERD